jgi:hypothetical protein
MGVQDMRWMRAGTQSGGRTEWRERKPTIPVQGRLRRRIEIDIGGIVLSHQLMIRAQADE